jgi:hypothetical protein
MKPHKPKKNQTNEGLVNMMKSVLVRLINLDMAHTLEGEWTHLVGEVSHP